MRIQDALNVLGLEPGCNQDQIKAKYRELSKIHHPDLGGSLEMMQVLNNAKDCLENYSGENVEYFNADNTYYDRILEAINKVKNLNVTIEIIGSWVWVSGDTKQYKEQLKDANYKWHPTKKTWFFTPDKRRFWSKNKTSMDDIRSKYGTSTVKRQGDRDQSLALA